jgi:hypothetical protein
MRFGSGRRLPTNFITVALKAVIVFLSASQVLTTLYFVEHRPLPDMNSETHPIKTRADISFVRAITGRPVGPKSTHKHNKKKKKKKKKKKAGDACVTVENTNWYGGT